MGREVRRVPADWDHPIDPSTGRPIPLFDGSEFEPRLMRWNEDCAKWNAGEFPEYASPESRTLPFSEWDGEQPQASDYMPAWSDEQRTHLMMYETTSEGTPISPAFDTPERLAQWLVDNKASAFGSMTASYEGWLRVAQGGYACSMISTAHGMVSGVDAQ